MRRLSATAGHRVSELSIDALGDEFGIGEISLAQEQGERGEVAKIGRYIALGDGSVGDASDGGVIELLADSDASGTVAADGKRALRGGIDLAVFAAQRGQQKGSAVQAIWHRR